MSLFPDDTPHYHAGDSRSTPYQPMTSSWLADLFGLGQLFGGWLSSATPSYHTAPPAGPDEPSEPPSEG